MDTTTILSFVKDFILLCIYPVLAYLGKRIITRAERIEQTQQEHSIRISVNETKTLTIENNINEIKKSIDALPERIKSDIKDIITSRK